jgi:hypothetical protein
LIGRDRQAGRGGRAVPASPLFPCSFRCLTVEAMRSRRSKGEGLSCIVAKHRAMRAMALIWAVILIGGITYFSIIGLTHH